MSKQVRLSTTAIHTIKAEMRPRESRAEALDRMLEELKDFREHVRIHKDPKGGDK